MIPLSLIIFYNVENWLPFACYFLIGAISGYTRDKYDDDIIYAKEEHDILEKKYNFFIDDNLAKNKILQLHRIITYERKLLDKK